MAFGETECENAPPNASCDRIETGVDIFYNGKEADQAAKDEMFALLTEVIQAQGASGSFSDAGTLHSVEATSDESGSNDGSSPVGLAVGVAVAALVVGAIGAGYYYRKRSVVVAGGRESTSNKHEATDDSSNEGDRPVEVHATLVEETQAGEKKKY